MCTRKMQLVAVLVMIGALAGCGKAASPDNVEPPQHAVPASLLDHKQVLPMDKQHLVPSPPVGVVVDGRVYPKGEVPVLPSATPAPASPADGHGHLHIAVSLQGKQAFVNAIRVTVAAASTGIPKGFVFSQTFSGTVLEGNSLDATALNLAPGDYAVTVTTLDQLGHEITHFNDTETVEAGKTVDSKL
jgi:hypothetical protein